eukprot:TRINITY_DN4172_c0_g1_i2.p1 TRINITY_DN4172_c0_g1~~TRINITY_DN4172_c0_g1_i2.p1  ORF type:complete len:175 (+),score=41.80 TRINITY_DN4172_c0_g1_i2:416-940(+)
MSEIPEIPDAPAAPATATEEPYLDPRYYRNDALEDSPLTSSGEEDLGQDWFEKTNERMEETQAVTVPGKIKKGAWKGVFKIYQAMYWLGEQFAIMFGFHEASWDPIFEAHQELQEQQAEDARAAQEADGAELQAMEGGAAGPSEQPAAAAGSAAASQPAPPPAAASTSADAPPA